ncbi:MAG: type II toxin-antitoxin system PrlF family antitoxin [Comamonadaceae bacterium]|nr:type II toxin-antitoxin system PrlF family antitoxin [Comamonadaceae bacterium]
MSAILEAESKLTERYQTTVPESVRRALKLGKRDKIRFTIRPDGDVVLTRSGQADDEDPVMGHFLKFLAHDMTTHPERLTAIDTNLVHQIGSLVSNAVIDLDEPLSADDE